MCVAAGAAAVLSGLGLATSAYSSYAQGKAAQQAANYQAAILENNAKITQIQAQQAVEQTESEKLDVRRQYQRLTGTGKTAYAAGNVLLGSGTPLAWETDVKQSEAEDISRLEYNLSLQKYGLDVEAQNYKNQAALTRMQGASAARAGTLGAFSTLLGGAQRFAVNFGSSKNSTKKTG